MLGLALLGSVNAAARLLTDTEIATLRTAAAAPQPASTAYADAIRIATPRRLCLTVGCTRLRISQRTTKWLALGVTRGTRFRARGMVGGDASSFCGGLW
jgi:hypothetical protein